MLLGLGVDLLSLPRLQALIARRTAHRLAERICSPRELAAFASLPAKHPEPSTLKAQQLRFLASRWAAKEAAYKALPWPTGWGWKNLDLSYSVRGKPTLSLLPPQGRDAEAIARRRARKGDPQDGLDPARIELMLSLSHDGDMIVAAVVGQQLGE
ncbi:hypothetical protein CcaverHIS002_0406800 [Cutaneotrichosporon cavernicola]|uniref:4'-phosphopantetheinyl transferase domain-containing protein n=1 Tax=Cutaneotrichosporon cavernicola TaxID=279322 RepID=A0AA48QVZ5_9TREE|nr:uncharacterized protein CcaverHIS019_0406800 [Cutaneotrichosporon cavernicola]BEI84076.1 hypothetical protein CcaverHIS002_0406800 [Cutaneotrichosporon cavernicola]BEI91860.1 hypothetical protein CcaverHIS019_0406800 [Cutaneotrichosporon cavernicola]BEI99632.1 hypothetical protein CcaverHIS631_0406750 [Cutaneotrichosporon cavernicola]BEJ07408.1 hypothetical protein CcaverHIS641_0406770 [Cutaneotrichosporon cavernicola]